MALILTVLLLISFSGICACNENEELSLREVVMELKKTISYQNRITLLEDRARGCEIVNENQSNDIAELTKRIKKEQEEKNLTLIKMQTLCEENSRKFEHLFSFAKTSVGGQPSDLSTSSVHPTSNHASKSSSLIRKEKLAPREPSLQHSESTVAFYAYLSHNIPSPSTHYVLTFDTVITNAGDGYHHFSGIFIAPSTGFYAFTWSFRIQNDAHISTELIVNNLAVGAFYFDAEGGVGGNEAGTVVVHVDQGNVVFVRTTSGSNLGDIISDHEVVCEGSKRIIAEDDKDEDANGN